MTRRNVYMNQETQMYVEEFMSKNNILTHTEAVRNIILEHHSQTEK